MKSWRYCVSFAALSLLLLLTLTLASRNPQSARIPLASGGARNSALQERLETSHALAMLEQQVEDYNAQWVATAPDASTAASTRRLICLPLDERFDPPMGVFSHGHVQTGDKMSVPRNFWQAIQVSQAEVSL